MGASATAQGPRDRAAPAAGPARGVRPGRAAPSRPGGCRTRRRDGRGRDRGDRHRGALRFAEVEVALDTVAGDALDRLGTLDAHVPWPATGRLRHAGTAAGLVRLLTELAGVVDGVRLRPLVLDEDLPELSARVLPALFEARIAARPVAGSTLRATFGLPRPQNRFAAEELSA